MPHNTVGALLVGTDYKRNSAKMHCAEIWEVGEGKLPLSEYTATFLNSIVERQPDDSSLSWL